jgi:hypothetical protein
MDTAAKSVTKDAKNQSESGSDEASLAVATCLTEKPKWYTLRPTCLGERIPWQICTLIRFWQQVQSSCSISVNLGSSVERRKGSSLT